MNNRIAIIDMGTNTFHLLIAEVLEKGYRIVCRTRLAVKIGKGGINDGYITAEGVARALHGMKEFKRISDTYDVTKIHAFGTSALRNAKNGAEVIVQIKSLTGIDVTIITGEQEAMLIYYGVRAALDLGEDKSLIIDIGGGSVEFIIGNRHEIFWKQSFEIGAQRLLEKFHRTDPITMEEIDFLNDHLTAHLPDLFNALVVHKPTTLVGSSGTFDTLSDIFCIQNNIDKGSEDTETPLTKEGFFSICQELLGKDREERMKIPGMIEMRVDMIVSACCLISFLLKRYSFSSIRVSSYSLKEGALAQFQSSMVIDN